MQSSWSRVLGSRLVLIISFTSLVSSLPDIRFARIDLIAVLVSLLSLRASSAFVVW